MVREKKAYAPEIDALKGISILGVLFLHMSFKGRLEAETLEIIDFLQFFLSWSVTAFFFSSGFLSKPIDTKSDFKLFFKKKFVRLIIPCLTFSILYKILIIGLSLSNVFSWTTSIPNSLEKLLLFLLLPASPQFYFLYYLFGISLLCFIIEKFLSIQWVVISSSLIMSLVYFFIPIPQDLHGPEFSLLPVYLYSYMLGCLVSLSKKKISFFAFMTTF